MGVRALCRLCAESLHLHTLNLFKGLQAQTATVLTGGRGNAGSGRRWLPGGAIIKGIQMVCTLLLPGLSIKPHEVDAAVTALQMRKLKLKMAESWPERNQAAIQDHVCLIPNPGF